MWVSLTLSLVAIPHAGLVRQLGKVMGSQLSSVERAVCRWLGLPATSSGGVKPIAVDSVRRENEALRPMGCRWCGRI